MPDDVQPLIRLGPFGGLNTRVAQPFESPNDAVVASNADTHRLGGALSNVMGRSRLVTFGNLIISGAAPAAGIVSLARYDVSPTVTYYIAFAYGANA